MSAYFVIEQSSPQGELKDFVFRLDDPRRIEEARAILASPSALKRHVQGTVVESVACNPAWPFHLHPATIGFFEMQTGVCDVDVTYVQGHLDEIGGAVLSNGFWCPWSSALVREVACSPV